MEAEVLGLLDDICAIGHDILRSADGLNLATEVSFRANNLCPEQLAAEPEAAWEGIERAMLAGLPQLCALPERVIAGLCSPKPMAHSMAAVQLGAACMAVAQLARTVLLRSQDRGGCGVPAAVQQCLYECAALAVDPSLLACVKERFERPAASQAAMLAALADAAAAGLGDPAIFCEQLARPQRMLAWLQVAVDTTLRSGPVADWLVSLATPLCSLAASLTGDDCFQTHAAALQRNRQLLHSLLQLLLRVGKLHLVAAALPADRRPAGISWGTFGCLVVTLSSACLEAPLQQALAHGEQAGTAGSSAWALLRDAARLVQRAPDSLRCRLSGPEQQQGQPLHGSSDEEQKALWCSTAHLLAALCRGLGSAMQQLSDQQRQQAAGLLLQAAEAFPVVLAHAASECQQGGMSDDRPGSPTAVCGEWCMILVPLGKLLLDFPASCTAGGLAALPAACAAASALLRALPGIAVVAAVAAQHVNQQQHDTEATVSPWNSNSRTRRRGSSGSSRRRRSSSSRTRQPSCSALHCIWARNPYTRQPTSPI
ncbi:hypothetical protein ABPG75_010599 [Micractinium tetrahymenae]